MEIMMADYSRQSFLGADSQRVLNDVCVGLVGYSGGGSHFGQQFGHIGVGNFVVVDHKRIASTHRPRFVGSEPEDVENDRLKVDIAERQIKRGNLSAQVKKLPMKWQETTDDLLECDIIFGAVDSYQERNELERFCRRNMIPYIDIGMDVCAIDDEEYSISGQVIQSLPGGHCMRCCQFISDEKLTREAEKYGDAGPAPQVIWANGVLASTAVGWGVALLCPWRKEERLFRWFSYDGNTGELKTPSMVSQYLDGKPCPHHPITELGDPLCDIRQFRSSADSELKDSSLTSEPTHKRLSIKSVILSMWRRIASK